MDTIRLAIFMILGAYIAVTFYMPAVGNLREMNRQVLPTALLGAFAGLAVECWRRSGQKTEKKFWRFSMVELLVAMTIASLGLAVIVWKLKN